jgi:uncharacterized protein involved in response to NO
MFHSLRRLADAPHRLFFFLGTLSLITASIWWLCVLALRQAPSGWLASAAGMSAHLHPLIMIYGFFPFFIFGFSFTAGPRWLQMPPPARRDYLLPGAGMGAAFFMLYPAMFVSDGAVVFALALYAVCAGLLWLRFSALIANSRTMDKVHARLVQLSLAVGGITLLYSLISLTTGHDWRDVTRSAGVWGFLVPLFCTVCHRMLPFFTASALHSDFLWRPWWLLGAMVAGSWLHGMLEYSGSSRWLWIIDGPMAFVCFTMVWRWGLIQSLRNRLLAMLHLSFIWLAIAYTLSFVQALLAHAGISVLGVGPVHAVSIGFLASITIAMVTRVTCGHSGRTLAADKITWSLFLVFQLATISRVAAEAFPAYYAGLIVTASAIWCACFGIWVWRNARIYLSPREDGMPG